MRLPWSVAAVLGVTTFIHYLDRNNLAIVLPEIARSFGWSDREVGEYGEWILGAFYASFGLVQIFLSPYAERWGLRRSLLSSVMGFSVVTLLFYPLGRSVEAIILLRLLLGAAESIHMPTNSALVSRYFPPTHRARANSVYVGGILLALMVGPWLIIPLTEKLGWRAAFLLLGSAGLLLSIPLILRFIPPDRPAEARSASSKAFSWRAVLSGYGAPRPVLFYLYVGAGAANAFCIFGMLNWLPTYLNRQQGIPFHELSTPLFSVFLAGVVGLIGWAFLGDRKGQRIPLAAGGLFLAGVCVWLTAYTEAPLLTLALLIVGFFFQSSYNAQEFATLQGMVSPDRVGAASGLYNGLTVLVGGIGGSFIPGSLVALTGNFQVGILSVAGGAWIVSLCLGLLWQLQKRVPSQTPHA